MRERPGTPGAEEENCETVSFTTNLSGKRAVFGQNSEKLLLCSTDGAISRIHWIVDRIFQVRKQRKTTICFVVFLFCLFLVVSIKRTGGSDEKNTTLRNALQARW